MFIPCSSFFLLLALFYILTKHVLQSFLGRTWGADIAVQSLELSSASWELVRVLTVLLFILVPANMPGKTAGDGPHPRATTSHLADPGGPPGFWPSPGHCSYLGSGPVNGISCIVSIMKLLFTSVLHWLAFCSCFRHQLNFNLVISLFLC